METRLSRYLLLILLMLIIGLAVEEYRNDGLQMTTKDKVVELFLANRYKAGIYCRDQGWQFCQSWADLPRSQFTIGAQTNTQSKAKSQSSSQAQFFDAHNATEPNLSTELFTKHSNQNQSHSNQSQPRTEQHQQLFNHQDEMLSSQMPGCATSALNQAEQAQRQQNKKRIYSWTDDNGQVHFTDDDRENTEHTIALTEYQEPEYAFELHVDAVGGKLPLYYKDKVSAAIKKVSERYEDYLPTSGVIPVRVNLTLAKSRRSYNKLRQTFAPGLGPSQGFYVAKHNMAVVHYKNDHQAHQTAIHEAVHVLNAGLFGPTPRWFNEGLAEYFESIEMAGYSATIPPRDWLKTLSGSQLNLQQLLNAEHQTWSGSQQSSLYAQSHSLIHFLMSTQQGKDTLKGLLAHMIQTRCERSDPNTSLSQYPGGLDALQNDWAHWMNSRRYRVHVF